MRAAAKAAELEAVAATPVVVVAKEPSPQPKRERRVPPTSPATMTSAPLQKMQQRSASVVDHDQLDEREVEGQPAPVTQVVNPRPLTWRQPSLSSTPQSVSVHPAQPIPPPHFEIAEPALTEDESSHERESASQSSAIPPGDTREQWRNLSKKDRKRLQRSETIQ